MDRVFDDVPVRVYLPKNENAERLGIIFIHGWLWTVGTMGEEQAKY